MVSARLVRHGQTYWNERGLIQGNIDVGLNETGVAQARQLAGQFSGEVAYDMVTSPLRRARQTAELLCEEISVENYRVIPQLRELDQGHWNGLPGERVRQRIDPAHYKNWEERPFENPPPAGETLQAVERRVKQAVDYIAGWAENPTIVVGHKVIISMIAAICGRWSRDELFERLPENAGVFRVELTCQEE